MRIIIDTDNIKDRIMGHWYSFPIQIKTKLGIKNKGFYKQVQVRDFRAKGCPRCGAKNVKFVKKSPNGICCGHINECQTCGQWFDLVENYENW